MARGNPQQVCWWHWSQWARKGIYTTYKQCGVRLVFRTKVAASNTNNHISKEKYRVDRTSRVFMNYWQTASRIVVMLTFSIGVETAAFLLFIILTPPAMAVRSAHSALRGASPRLTTTFFGINSRLFPLFVAITRSGSSLF